MKKIYFLIHFSFTILVPLSTLLAQPLAKQWDKRYGGTDTDELFSLQQTADGGYLLGGLSASLAGADKTKSTQGNYDYWIVKTDANGNKQWDKDFGGLNFDYFSCTQQTTDGGYILGGSSFSGVGGDKTQASRDTSANYTYRNDYWIVKTDSQGIKKWDRDFGGIIDDYMTSLQQTTDGGYILGGYSRSGIGGDKTQLSFGGNDYWVIKIDSLGIKQWDKDFGGPADDYLQSIRQTGDGGYILGGYSNSGIGGNKLKASNGGYDYWVVKIDSLGAKTWESVIGGTADDYLLSLTQTIDGGYILGGYSNSGTGGDKTQASYGANDFWMVKLDSMGVKQWDRVFGGSDYDDGIGNISQTADSGYLIAGSSYSPISGNKTESNLAAEQTWVVKTDALGNKQWDKTVITPGHDEIGYAIQTKDGCYVFANYTGATLPGGYVTQGGRGGSDYWFVRFCDTTNVTIIPPVSNFTASDSVLCANDCVSFTNFSSNATSYQWYFAGGNPASSTDQNPQHVCYPAGGNYDVTLIAINGSSSDTLTFTNYIKVKPAPPTPVITQVGTTLYCSTDPTYSSYQWYDSTTIISGATDTFLVVTHSGNYNVQVSNENGCKIAVGINVILTGLAGYLNENLFSLSPNPATNQLTIHASPDHSKEAVSVSILNVLGEKMLTYSLSFREGRGETIDVSKLSSGIYLVNLQNERVRWVSKFVKE